MEHIVRIDFREEVGGPKEELRDYIERHNELEIKEPDGTIGVVEAGTIIIAISATYDLVTSLIRDLNGLLDSEAVTAIDDIEQTGRWYIGQQTAVEAEELELQKRTQDGPDVELIFIDQRERNHRVVLNRHDIDLDHVEYSLD
jgi:hypothetical protein